MSRYDDATRSVTAYRTHFRTLYPFCWSHIAERCMADNVPVLDWLACACTLLRCLVQHQTFWGPATKQSFLMSTNDGRSVAFRRKKKKKKKRKKGEEDEGKKIKTLRLLVAVVLWLSESLSVCLTVSVCLSVCFCLSVSVCLCLCPVSYTHLTLPTSVYV